MSDLIFASSMTILILLLQLPTVEQIDSPELFEIYLDDSLPRLYLFLVTFLVIAIYWVKDIGQFRHIVETDNTHIWLQLGSLMFLVMLPWVNALMEIKPDNLNVRIIFCVDMFAIGIFSALAWNYASKNHRLIQKETEQKLIREIRSSNYTEPIVALVAIGAALFLPDYFPLTFILIPLLFVLQKKVELRVKRYIQARKNT